MSAGSVTTSANNPFAGFSFAQQQGIPPQPQHKDTPQQLQPSSWGQARTGKRGGSKGPPKRSGRSSVSKGQVKVEPEPEPELEQVDMEQDDEDGDEEEDELNDSDIGEQDANGSNGPSEGSSLAADP